MAFKPRAYFSTDDPERLRQELLELQNEISAALKARGFFSALQNGATYAANYGETVRADPPAGGLRLLLPAASADKIGASVKLVIKGDGGQVTVEAVKGTVNGAVTVTFALGVGITEFILDSDGWYAHSFATTVTGGTGGIDQATYTLETAHASLPNAYVATQSTEITPTYDTGPPRLLTWVIRAASVVAAKLTGAAYSVMARASGTSGAYGELTASENQYLGRSGSGDLAFGAVPSAAIASDETWSEVLARGATSGGNGDHPTISSGDQLRLDTAGTGSYPPTGDIRASGSLNVRATGSSDWRASAMTYTADSGAVTFTASLGLVSFDSATTMRLTAGTSMTQQAALGNNFFIQGGYLRMYTGSSSFTERFRIDPNGLWSIGTSFGTGSAGQYIRRTAGNNPPAWATISIADVSSDFDWAGVLAHDPATDGNDPEISNGDSLLFDTDGTQTYPGTGELQVSGNLIANATGHFQFNELIAGDPGNEGDSITINGVSYSSHAKVSEIGDTHPALLHLHKHATGAGAAKQPIAVFSRTNSDTSAHAVVTDGMGLGRLYFAGHDGTDYALGAYIGAEVDGTPGSNDMPTRLVFGTAADGSQGGSDRLVIHSGGEVEVQNGGSLLFDTAGDGDYTGLTGDVQANDGLRIDVDDSVGPVTVEIGTAANPWFDVTSPFFVWNGTGAAPFALFDPGFLVLTEQSASTPTVSAGRGMLWVRDDAPNVPMFTDDGNADHRLAYYDSLNLDTVQEESVSGADVDITLNADTTRLVLRPTAATTIRSISGAADGRFLVVEIFYSGGGGLVTFDHANSGGSGDRVFCPDSRDLTLGQRHSLSMAERGGAWRVLGTSYNTFDDTTPGVVPVSNGSADEYLSGDGNWGAVPALLARTLYLSGSGTHTFNAAATSARVLAVGAGAGGGGAGLTETVGGGGAAGGWFELSITSLPASSAYAVGAGGSGGAGSSGATGSDGGDTTFHDGSVTRTAAGGDGGDGQDGELAFGGPGGTTETVGGTVVAAGGGAPGHHGIYFGGQWGGQGGNSIFGGGGYSALGTDSGGDATAPGAGGAGASSLGGTDVDGGDGEAGYILVEEYS